MKKTFLFLACNVFALLLGGCGLLDRPTLTDQKSINKYFPSDLEKHINPQTTVFYLSMATTQDFSFEMDVASVTCLEPNASESAEFNIYLATRQPARRSSDFSNIGTTKKKTAETGIKLCEIDFSHIAANVNKAIEMLKAENYKADGISSYDMTFNGNPKETKHRFRVRCKGDTNFGADKRGAAAFVTQYVEFTFNADADGNVSMEK